MSRCIAFVLALLLPLQFAWAAAAPYCAHEAAPKAVAHVGHHDHVHQADAGTTPSPDAQSSDKQPLDPDCAVCHAACAPLMHAAPGHAGAALRSQPAPVATSDARASAWARAPDRPQWSRLA